TRRFARVMRAMLRSLAADSAAASVSPNDRELCGAESGLTPEESRDGYSNDTPPIAVEEVNLRSTASCCYREVAAAGLGKIPSVRPRVSVRPTCYPASPGGLRT